MRSRTDGRSGKTSPAPLEKHFREIVVGNGRAQEPYIIAFHYASDNVSGSPLGTLFGFFEVEIHDQDAAYIVNFLASVAKKEYFVNPRRSPVESFEAALHKINIALAEIVKHGNITWLGHLHGAIGTVNQNSLLFSVTGEGEIYLARGGVFRSISTGIADTSSEPHPLKTFTEVSSGELFDADLVFSFSPSIWSLFSSEDLQRSLNRLGPNDFEQFLRTALINELPTAAVTLLTCSAPVDLKQIETVKEAPKPSISLSNVWSGKPFEEAIQNKRTPPPPKQEPAENITGRDEYTDKKTGHIYVQASSEDGFEASVSPWKERLELYSHSFGTMTHGWNVTLRKITRRINKESSLTATSIVERTGRMSRSVRRRARSLKRHLEENRQRKAVIKEQAILSKAAEEIKPRPNPQLTPERVESPGATKERESQIGETDTVPNPTSERIRRFFDRDPRVEKTFSTAAQERWNLLYQGLAPVRFTIVRTLRHIWSYATDRSRWSSRWLSTLFMRSKLFWNTRQPRVRWILIGVAILILGAIIVLAWPKQAVPPQETTIQISEPSPPPKVFPPAEEPLSTLLAGSRMLYPTNNSRSVALVNIDDTPILVTEKSIVNLKTQESTPAPEPLRFATAMNDLDAVFAIGDTSDTLYLWSAVTKKFFLNTLPLPVGTKIDALGSYLTYLYVLDQSSGTIQRYARTEGGFGSPSIWLKEPVSLAPQGTMAVNENIALSLQNQTLTLFSRGRKNTSTFSGTTTPVTTDALTFDQKSGDILVLDRTSKRIVRWSATGTLVGQYYNDSFGEVETFVVSPDGSELLVSQQGATTAWRIQ